MKIIHFKCKHHKGGSYLFITRETDYALRILRALSGGEQLTARDICQKELLPQQFAYKILKKLGKSGLVQITRGVDGGCRLAADLHEVSLFELMEIIEEGKWINACMETGFQCAWQQKYGDDCKINKHLLKIQTVLDSELRALSLHQMIFGD